MNMLSGLTPPPEEPEATKDFPVLTMDSEMPYGKYKGWIMNELVDEDPSYVAWMAENTDTEIDDEITDAVF